MTREGLTILRSALLDNGRVVLKLGDNCEQRSRDIAQLVADGLLTPVDDALDGDPAHLVYGVTDKGRAAVQWQAGNGD